MDAVALDIDLWKLLLQIGFLILQILMCDFLQFGLKINQYNMSPTWNL